MSIELFTKKAEKAAILDYNFETNDRDQITAHLSGCRSDTRPVFSCVWYRNKGRRTHAKSSPFWKGGAVLLFAAVLSEMITVKL